MPTVDSTGMKGLTDVETVDHLRLWANGGGHHGPFAWPTDGCGYDQHIRFVKHRNENWHGGNNAEFKEFVRDYADMLEKESTQFGSIPKKESSQATHAIKSATLAPERSA